MRLVPSPNHIVAYGSKGKVSFFILLRSWPQDNLDPVYNRGWLEAIESDWPCDKDDEVLIHGHSIKRYSKVSTPESHKGHIRECEGGFCRYATCCTEVSRNVGWALRRKRVKPKIQPRAEMSAQRLMGQLPWKALNRVYQAHISMSSDKMAQQ